MAAVSYKPTYSHGGSSSPGWAAVAGNATGAGRPIMVYGAIQSCALYISIVSGSGTATVTVEANGGALDSNGNPPSADWVDQSPEGTGYVMSSADTTTRQYLILPATKAPFWRTKILAISGVTIESAVSQIIVSSPAGFPMAVAAKYPTLTTDAAQGADQV